MITSDEEAFIDGSLVINLNLIKIYVTKDHEFASSMAKYVSPNITIQNLLNCLCKTFYFPTHQSILMLKTGQNNMVELDNKKATLIESNIKDGDFLTISRNLDSLLGYSSIARNQETANVRERDDDMESSKANEDEDRPLRHQFSQESDFGGNYSTNSRDSSDSAKLSTGSF